MKKTEDAIAKQKAIMMNAIEAYYGNISKAAKMAKITTQTHYRWLKEDRQYAVESENTKDICFRNRKEQLLEIAFELAKKSNVTVVNKLLSIYCKYLPEEIKMASHENNVPVRATIKWVSTPQDPKREGYVKPNDYKL